MRRTQCSLLTSLLIGFYFSFSATYPGKASEGIVLPTQGANCQMLKSEREESAWRCPGPAGSSLEYADFVMRGGLTFGLGKQTFRPIDSDDLSWAPDDSGIGSRIEWRVNNGKPFAAIVGRWRRVDDAVPPAVFGELLVVKVSENGACKVAVLGALAAEAMSAARSIADQRAPGFRCGVDKAVDSAISSNALLSRLDGRFSSREMLNHNGSIVELTRSPEGRIEIRYIEPRKELRVSPGTQLFQGTEQNGKIKGEAFVFRPDCVPAGYPVAGERKDGILVLEGSAPQRAPRSCQVNAGGKVGKPSRLVFVYEPVLQSALAAAQQVEAPAIADCPPCISATIKSIDGVGSARASITAQVTSDDIKRYCEAKQVSEAGQDECIRDNAGEIGKILRSNANCTDLTIEPSAGGRFKFYKMGDDYGGPAPVWINLDKNDIECGARSCIGPTASAHFALLCPSALPGWKGHRAEWK